MRKVYAKEIYDQIYALGISGLFNGMGVKRGGGGQKQRQESLVESLVQRSKKERIAWTRVLAAEVLGSGQRWDVYTSKDLIVISFVAQRGREKSAF